ncbi:MAG: hypothetical protein GX238_06995 [Epulopiscium sp.]|nr:hypothetical protein [Candidatus Epulonipiscium sp.]
MKKEQRYYMYGSSAPKLEKVDIAPLQFPSDIVQPQVQPKPRTGKKVQQKKNMLYKLQLLGCTMIFFIGCLILMIGYSAVSYQQKNIEQMNKNLQALQKENAMIQGEIGQSMDLKVLEEKATQQLGMVRPKEHQVINIEIPKASHTVRYQSTEVPSTEISFLSSVFRFLVKGW